MNVDRALKFVWAYMIENGHPTSGVWSYYGGHFESEDYFNYHKKKQNHSELKDRIKRVGVNWDKTEAPKSSQEYEFQGTFTDASRVETLLGDLVLNDGTSIKIGVSGAELRFAEYVKTLADLAADEQLVRDILGEPV